MKWFISKWETTSTNGLYGTPKDLAERSTWLIVSEGTYVHILSIASLLGIDYMWEIVYQDANGRWQEHEDDEDSLEKAKGKVMRVLLEAGYRAIHGRCQVLE